MNLTPDNIAQVTLLGDGVGNLILGNRLLAGNMSVAMIGSFADNTASRPDEIRLPGHEQGISLSYLQDAHGIAKICLDNTGLDVDEVATPVELCDAVPVGERLILRGSSLDDYVETLCAEFAQEAPSIREIFSAINSLKEENKKVFSGAKHQTDIRLYAKYFNYGYKQFLREYNLSDELEKLLLTYSPWDDVSLITMAGYWGQISDISRFNGGYKGFYETLLNYFTSKGGIYIPHMPLKDVQRNGSSILIENSFGTKYSSDSIVYQNSSCFDSRHSILSERGLKEAEGETERFGSNILMIHNPAYQSLSERKDIAYYRYREEIQGSPFRFNLSGFKEEYAKVEIVGPLTESLWSEVNERLTAFLKRIAYPEGYRIVAFYSSADLERYTGISGGCLYQWAHSVREVKSNPLAKLQQAKGVYFTGDWGNGYFYAAELYGRDIAG